MILFATRGVRKSLLLSVGTEPGCTQLVEAPPQQQYSDWGSDVKL